MFYCYFASSCSTGAVQPRIGKTKKGEGKKERRKEGSPSRVLYILYLIAAPYIMQYLSAAQHSYSSTSDLQPILFSSNRVRTLPDLRFTDARDTHPMVPVKLQIASHPRPIDKPIAQALSKSAVLHSLTPRPIHTYVPYTHAHSSQCSIIPSGWEVPEHGTPSLEWALRYDRHRFLAIFSEPPVLKYFLPTTSRASVRYVPHPSHSLYHHQFRRGREFWDFSKVFFSLYFLFFFSRTQLSHNPTFVPLAMALTHPSVIGPV